MPCPTTAPLPYKLGEWHIACDDVAMHSLPELLIVTDYHTLAAYLIQPDGRAQILKQIDFEHDSQTSVPMVEWTSEDRAEGFVQVGETIDELLCRYQPPAWGLACPQEFGERLLDRLPEPCRQSLALLRMDEVQEVDIANVTEWFQAAQPPPPSLESN